MSLKKTAWELTAFEESDIGQPLIPNTKITAIFGGDSLGGSGGCNSYGASVAFDAGDTGMISITDLFSTQVFCSVPSGVSSQESKYFEFLNSVKIFKCNGDLLRLTNGTAAKERALSFKKCKTCLTTEIASERARVGGEPVCCEGVETRDWYAWNNKMPPKPDDFHIVGEVYVSNPGVEVSLFPRVPQGINRRILLIELHLRQLPGIWPRVLTWKQVKFDKIMVDSNYESVEVFCGSEAVAEIAVEDIL
jgi:heat shock protein HslJ